MIKVFILLLFCVSILKIQSEPVICIDATLSLIVNTECSDLKVYRLNQDLCSFDLQKIDVDLSKDVKKFWFLYFQSSQGIPVSEFSKDQLMMFPNLAKIIAQMCSPEEKSFKNTEFLSLGESYTGLNDVYLQFYNASGMSGNKGTYNNFYQYAPSLYKLTTDSKIRLTMKDMNKIFQSLNDEANYTVESIKLYSQYATHFPRDPLMIESKLALENPLKHTIDMVSYVIYDLLNTQVPEEQREKISHELNEICLKDNIDNKTSHFIINRVAAGAEKLKFWNTKVDIIYIGEGDGCALNSTKWADVKSGICNETGEPCLIARGEKDNMNYSSQKTLDLVVDFIDHYRKFNSVFNCQHFGTNFYNTIAEDNLDFENWKIMTVHSSFSDINPKIDFLDLPKH